jgi:glycosyltransferase involved in cell wall biosynthesis
MGNLSQDSHPSGGASHHHVTYLSFSPIPKDEARRALGLETKDYLVLFATNPKEPIKQYLLAEEAVALARTELPGIRLLLASGVPSESMPLYMNACDALLLTSAHEGSPNVVKEAVACDTPVVVVHVGDVAVRRMDGRSAVLDLSEHRIAERVVGVYERAVGTRGEEV